MFAAAVATDLADDCCRPLLVHSGVLNEHASVWLNAAMLTTWPAKQFYTQTVLITICLAVSPFSIKVTNTPRSIGKFFIVNR